jgi:hypothetical protein
MSRTPADTPSLEDLVAAAREKIRNRGDACIVSVFELLDELSAEFGDRFSASSDTYLILDLVEALWADPHVRPGVLHRMDRIRVERAGLLPAQARPRLGRLKSEAAPASRSSARGFHDFCGG